MPSAIGAPLDAEVDVYCAPPLLRDAAVVRRGAALRVHHFRRARAPRRTAGRPKQSPAEEGEGNFAWIVARPSAAKKCVRCWHKRADVGANAEHPELCGRCVTNVDGPGEAAALHLSDRCNEPNPLAKVWFTPTRGAQQLAVAVVLRRAARPGDQGAGDRHREDCRTAIALLPILDIVLSGEHRRGVQHPRAGVGLAALVLHRARRWSSASCS